MLKKIILSLTFLFPIFAFSQETDFTDKVIAKKTHGIVNSFKLDDHVGLFQINLSDTTFELIAVDDKLQLLWRSSYKGYGVTCGKLNNHILAISSYGHSKSKEFINPYIAYLIDEKSGKSIIEKQIFQRKAEHQELAAGFFIRNDSEFNLVIRQAHKRAGSIVAYFQDKTEDISIVNLNDKLEVKTIKPKIPDGTFASMTCNPSGDFYILMNNEDKTLEAWRYEYGNNGSSSRIILPFGSLEERDIRPNAIAASETDRSVLYLGICHNNDKNDRTIITGRFDFNSLTSKIDTQVFSGSYKRSLQNIYKPIGPDFLKPKLGTLSNNFNLNYIKEHDGRLIVTFSESFFANNGVTAGFYGDALLIYCYDGNNLRRLFYQLMPVQYKAAGMNFKSGFDLENGFLNVVSNDYQTFKSFSLFGRLDMSTGEWVKLREMSPDMGYFSDPHIIWFKDKVIVPYFDGRNIRLYVNEY